MREPRNLTRVRWTRADSLCDALLSSSRFLRLEFLGRGHFGDEAIVQFFGGVVAGHFQLGLVRGDFDEARQIAAGPNGNRDVRDVHAKDFDVFLFHADPVHVRDFVPSFQGDDEVDAFFAADAFDAEHGGDVDDADAAHFHVVARQLGAGADDFAAIHERDFGDVVGHQTVAAFNQREDAFAFADAAFAADDDANA